MKIFKDDKGAGERKKKVKMVRELLKNKGAWYKGNLHMHTTISDGRLEREEAIRRYVDKGYDFIAITDHRKNGPDEKREDILILSGAEWDTGDNISRPVFHILGIGPEEEIHLPENPRPEPEEIIAAIRKAGGIAILAHPAWSVMDPEDIKRCRGILAAEIYNTISGLPKNADRADSSLYFDIWASKGIMVRATAADDAHDYRGDECVSFVRVGAESCTKEDIMQALREGNFYASQGPEVTSMTYDEKTGDIHLECSEDVQTIYFSSNLVWSGERVIEDVHKRADYRVLSGEHYIRATLIAADGKRAWTSPFVTGR